MNDLISIIIPMYNAENFLTGTLDSVLNQSYKNWECLIIDDGSTDKSQEFANSYCNIDKRFKYFYQNNSGPSSARNRGLEKSNGAFIHFLDSDDVILPEYFQTLVEETNKVDDKTILYSNILLGNSTDIYKTKKFRKNTHLNRNVSFRDFYKYFGLKFLFIPGCVLFPRKTLEDVKWNEQLSHSEDWDLYLQITKKGFAFRNLSEKLFIYRNTPGSLSKNATQTIKTNYIILSKWVTYGDLFSFCNRSAILFKRNIILFLLNKNGSLINPYRVIKKQSINLSYFIILIYLLTIIHICFEFTSWILKKILKIKN